MVVNIVNEKDFSDTIYNKEIKDKSGNVVDDYDVKRVLSSRRMMYFLNNGVIRAGGRFDGLPEKLELSAENFMKAFEAGVKGSKIDDVMTDEEFEKTKSEDNEELSKNYDKLIKNEMAEKEKVKEDDLKSEIFNKFNNYAANNKITKPMLLEIQKINKEHGIKNYNDIPSIPMDVAKKIEAILNTIEE